MAKYTPEDIVIIAREMRRVRDNRGKSFSLITGAGCSKSAGIPLATELVKEIHEKYGDECHRQIKDKNKIHDYGDCMNCLSKNERRELLEPHLKNARVNWAHIAIATMMEAGYITRVLTFNFDSILAKACSLVGLYPATYDFAAAATIETDYIAPQAIIHLHGQGYGASLLNTDDETEGHAENIEPLIRNTLRESPLLIIGYSGQSDGVFPIIRKLYKGDERLWWAGYNESAIPEVQNLINSNKRTAHFLGECNADLFLIALARELGCFPPQLFKDPYGYLLNQLDPVTEFPEKEKQSRDILSSLRDELKTAKDNRNIVDFESMLMAGNWKAVIEHPESMLAEQTENLAWAYLLWGNEKAQGSDIARYKEAVDKYKKAIELKPSYHEAYDALGAALLGMYGLEKNMDYLNEAEKILEESEKIDNSDTYNLACAYARLKKQEKCKEKLLHCKKAGTLPVNPREHMLNDPDLSNIQSLDWFKELISDLPS